MAHTVRTRKRAVEMYLTPERPSGNEIARVLGIPVSTVEGWLDQAGVRRPREVAEALRQERLKVTKKPLQDRIRYHYTDRGLSARKTAEALKADGFDVVSGTVSRWVKILGISRGPSEAGQARCYNDRTAEGKKLLDTIQDAVRMTRLYGWSHKRAAEALGIPIGRLSHHLQTPFAKALKAITYGPLETAKAPHIVALHRMGISPERISKVVGVLPPEVQFEIDRYKGAPKNDNP